jgi:hypothetical protein
MDGLQMKLSATSITQVNTKNAISSWTYSFKKRKPLPGAYPKNFSPYLLTNTSTPRVVPLSRMEIRKDLHDIQEAMATEFSSHYFEEDGTAPTNGLCVERTCQKSSLPLKIQRRAPRRSNFSSIQAPMTEAEERRQLRAALKASQLEGGRMSDENGCSKMRTADENLDIAAKKEASDGAQSLRRVCRGNIFRTG